jgi:hypothetical protein
MKKTCLNVLFLATLTLCSVSTTLAWDDVGHKITAYIAWQQMTPDVRERVIKILLAASEDSQLATFYQTYGSQSEDARRLMFFKVAATWPDIIRDRNFETRYKKYHHSNWHYTDTAWTVKDGKVQLVNLPDEGGLALDKIIEFIKLESSGARDSEKAIGIAWLEHLIGDIHQPLHASARITEQEPKGDQGGNLFLLTPVGTPRDKQENLHWFWDSIVIRNIPNSKDDCEQEYIDPIARDIMKKYPFSKMQSRLSLNDPERWKRESFEIASTRIYPPDLKRNEMPSDAYKKAALKIAEERLALAGYRMAALFDQIFGTAAVKPSPVK